VAALAVDQWVALEVTRAGVRVDLAEVYSEGARASVLANPASHSSSYHVLLSAVNGPSRLEL